MILRRWINYWRDWSTEQGTVPELQLQEMLVMPRTARPGFVELRYKPERGAAFVKCFVGGTGAPRFQLKMNCAMPLHGMAV